VTAPLPGWRHSFSGKVREVYIARRDPDVLLLLATDRVSAYDHVLRPDVPGKGALLTAISRWWFERLVDLVPNHLLGSAAAPPVPAAVADRAMISRRLDMVAVECVARGYLAGSAWAEYRATGAVSGYRLPRGLLLGSALPRALFTPATKAPPGDHDENMTVVELAARVGAELAAELERVTLAVYRRASEVAAAAGLIVADTKLEFGHHPATGELMLADEVLTPDSSRYWLAADWNPGEALPQFDKQVIRDWLAGPESGWSPDSDGPPPPLPGDVVAATARRYRQVLERLSG